MKIRMLDNSLRLRLSQSEVKLLNEAERVHCTVSFGASSDLHYSIQKGAEDHIFARFEANEIKVFVPAKMVETWADSNEVSLSSEYLTDNQSTLKILIEKDFKCLSVRDGEDESDLFPNPEKQHSDC